MTSYEKLKYIVRKLLKDEVIMKDLDELESIGISESIYGKFITKLNHTKILTSSSKGENRLKSNLINKDYFFDDAQNSSVISSIAHLEKRTTKSLVINYLFKLIPEQFYLVFNNTFSNSFNENLSVLLEEDDRFSYFISIIEANYDETKIICDITIDQSNEHLEIVPLEYFIYENIWHLCFYNIQKKSLDIISSQNIQKSCIAKNNYYGFVERNKIRDTIVKFVKDFELEESFLVRLNVETLNQLIVSKLINNYDVYEEQEIKFKEYKYPKNGILKDMRPSNPFKIVQKQYSLVNRISKKRLYKIKLFPKDYPKNFGYLKNYSYSSEEVIFGNDIEKYFVKISTTRKKFDYIIKNFQYVEKVDSELYRI